MPGSEAAFAFRMAQFYKQREALELDRAARVALLQQEIDTLQAAIDADRAAHEAECRDCQTNKFCLSAFTCDDRYDQLARCRSFIRAEQRDQEYAERAKLHPVDPRQHIDGFCSYWQNLRYRRLALANRRCENGCGRLAEDTRHLHRSTLGFEEIGDVRVLCRACHEAEHITYFRN